MIDLHKGFTLIELLFTIAIIFIITNIAAPSFIQLIQSSRSQDILHNMFTLIQYTRSKAVFTGEDVLLCPSDDNKNCNSDWTKPLIIFIDQNSNRIRDKGEFIDRSVSLLKSKENIIWRAFGSNRYIRFVNDGSTEYQSGNLTICLDTDNVNHIKKIILYKSGRAREALKKEIKLSDCQ